SFKVDKVDDLFSCHAYHFYQISHGEQLYLFSVLMRLFLRHIVTIVLVFWIIRFATYTLVGFSTNFTSRLESLSFGHIAEWGNAYERMEEFKEWINQTDGKKKGIILGSST